MGRRRWKVSDVARDAFAPLHDFLFKGDFKVLSNDARALYAQLRRRHRLSIENGWTDDRGDVYLVFSREEMQEMICVSKNTVTQAMKALKNSKLVEEERLGLGRCNRIFLLYVTDDGRQESQKQGDRSADFGIQDSQTVGHRLPHNGRQEAQRMGLPHKEEIDKSYIDSIYLSETAEDTAPSKKENDDRLMDRKSKESSKSYEEYEETVKANIEYEYLFSDGLVTDEVNNMVDIIVDTLCSTAETIKIGKEHKPTGLVKRQLLKLTREHILYMVYKMEKNPKKIGNIKEYLLTSLYNATMSMESDYKALVNHDLNKREGSS